MGAALGVVWGNDEINSHMMFVPTFIGLPQNHAHTQKIYNDKMVNYA